MEHLESAVGLVSRASPVHTAMRNCTGDEGGPFGFGNQVLISSHRKLLQSKAVVVSVAEKPEQDSSRHGRERCYGGGDEGMAPSLLQTTDGAPP
jgi:hypothetical protein